MDTHLPVFIRDNGLLTYVAILGGNSLRFSNPMHLHPFHIASTTSNQTLIGAQYEVAERGHRHEPEKN
jgi:hypothetical protein